MKSELRHNGSQQQKQELELNQVPVDRILCRSRKHHPPVVVALSSVCLSARPSVLWLQICCMRFVSRSTLFSLEMDREEIMFHQLKPETGAISCRETDGADLSFPTASSAQMTSIGSTKSSHRSFIFYNRSLSSPH